MRLAPTGSDERYRWWSTLRDVPASYVSGRGEAERFLYYDGPTEAPPVVSARWRDGALELTPAAPLAVPPPRPGLRTHDRQALLVHIDSSGQISGWLLDLSTAGNWTPQHGPFRFSVPETLPLGGDTVPARFRQMLTDAGLSGEESAGLLASWDKEFFRTSGTRLLMRLSAADYEAQCPLTIRPAPTEVARVGILWTELPPRR